MKILNSFEALKEIGSENFTTDIEYMCQETFSFWYDSYYKLHPDLYPNWKTLYNIYLNIANGKSAGKYTHGFCAIHNGRIIGYVSFNHADFNIYTDTEKDNNALWMTDVFVWPEWRSKGIASRLIDYVFRVAEEMNEPLHLACEKHLISFYKNKGWNRLYSPFTNLTDHWTVMVRYPTNFDMQMHDYDDNVEFQTQHIKIKT
jgi:GNAT superfamily N-acetyltransferase